MCILNFGGVGDRETKYVYIDESIVLEALNFFAHAICCFDDHYLCQPTNEDVFNQMLDNEEKSFPYLFGSLDCMHWEWKNCPVQLQHKIQPIMLEVAAT